MKATGVIVAALDSVPDAIESWNHWYDLDHLPPNVGLPGIMSGRRYVCTPQLHALRAPGSDPWWAGRASSFLTVYTLCGDVNETFGAMVTLRDELDAAGRMFAEDLKVVRGGDGLTLQRISARSDLRNRPEELPFIGHTGLVVVRAQPDRSFSDEDHDSLAGALLSASGCLGLLSYASQVVAGTGLHLALLDGDVAESAGHAAAALNGLGFAHSAYAAITPLDYGWADSLRAAGLPATAVAAPA